MCDVVTKVVAEHVKKGQPLNQAESTTALEKALRDNNKIIGLPEREITVNGVRISPIAKFSEVIAKNAVHPSASGGVAFTQEEVAQLRDAFLALAREDAKKAIKEDDDTRSVLTDLGEQINKEWRMLQLKQ